MNGHGADFPLQTEDLTPIVVIPRRALVFVFAATLACAGFAALGVWQVQRLAWKRALVARVEAHLRAAPVDAPGRAQWGGLTRDADEYRRVRLRGRYLPDAATPVRALTALGGGHWLLAPLRTDGGDVVLVNRGFVPPSVPASGTPEGEVEVVGLLRFSEPGGGFLQSNDPAAGRWTSRDVQAIGAARGLAQERLAPFFVDAAADPRDPQAWPRGGLTVVKFPNSHLEYAITWFLLALGSAGAAAYVVVDARRRR
jgi:surfeit locus 1 family protein